MRTAKQEQSKKSGERYVLRSCRAALSKTHTHTHTTNVILPAPALVQTGTEREMNLVRPTEHSKRTQQTCGHRQLGAFPKKKKTLRNTHTHTHTHTLRTASEVGRTHPDQHPPELKRHPPRPCASTLKVRKTALRRVPVLRQGSAHKSKPEGAVRKATVRRAPVLGQGSACERGGGGGGTRRNSQKAVTS